MDEVYIRFVEKEDIEDILNWRNDLETIKQSFNSKSVKLKDHEKWFNDSIKNKNRQIFIAFNKENEKIGQIRFDKNKDKAEIGITIAPEFRGKGYGSKVIKKACEVYLNNYDVSNLIAKIKKSNPSSLKAFEKAGFIEDKDYENFIEMIKKDMITVK